MSRRLRLTTLLLGSTLFAASVFGSEITAFAEKIPAMFVTNDDAHAVPVRDVNGRNAFAFFENDSYEDGEDAHAARFTVPEGKRLVIESLSIEAGLPAGQTMVLASVQARANDSFFVHHLGPTYHGQTSNNFSIFLVSQERTLYADGGTEVALTWVRNARAGGGITNASLVGYLIDCESDACK